MSHFKFTGKLRDKDTRVLIAVDSGPFCMDLNYSDGRASKLTADFQDASFTFDIQTSESVHKTEVSQLRDDLTPIARSIYDSIGYLTGRAIAVDIYGATDCETEENYLFENRVPALDRDRDHRPLGITALIPLAVRSVYLRLALGDLREAVLSPTDTAFFCFRAIESIRQRFCATQEDAVASWQNLSANLRIRRSFTEEIRSCAIPNRHGQLVVLSGEQRVGFLTRSWKVVDRFAEFLHGGETPLGNATWLE